MYIPTIIGLSAGGDPPQARRRPGPHRTGECVNPQLPRIDPPAGDRMAQPNLYTAPYLPTRIAITITRDYHEIGALRRARRATTCSSGGRLATDPRAG